MKKRHTAAMVTPLEKLAIAIPPLQAREFYFLLLGHSLIATL